MHPLMRTTRRTTAQPDGVRPEGATYDFHQGMWLRPDGPLCDSPDCMSTTKKADIETGEDQKGQ